MTETIEQRPLVTFALFAYNQEKYIREAVEGAFSQTYEPLEIILSDDCSSDRTFEIMQEMAAEYKGPHRVAIRKSLVNLGLIDHVREVVDNAKGTLIVMAAGDDISLEDRVHEIVRTWGGDAAAVFSAYDLIDPQGRLIYENVMPEADARTRFPWLRDVKNPLFVYGATSAYEKAFVRQLPMANRIVLSEDTPLNLMLQLSNGTVRGSSKSLVRYRVHSNTLSNSITPNATMSEILATEIKQRKKFKVDQSILIYIRDDILPKFPQSNDLVNRAYLDAAIFELNEKSNWDSSTFAQKIIKIFEAKPSLKKWMLLRILGIRFYTLMKVATLVSNGGQREWKK